MSENTERLDAIQQRAESDTRAKIGSGISDWDILWNAIDDRAFLLDLARKQQAALDAAAKLIRDLTDPDDCSFDHHGGCQAHGYLSLQPGETCPQHEAKEWART